MRCALHSLDYAGDVCPVCALFALHRETQQLVRVQQSQIADLVADQLSLRQQVNAARAMAQDAQDAYGRQMFMAGWRNYDERGRRILSGESTWNALMDAGDTDSVLP